MKLYDHRRPTEKTMAECEAAVGKRKILALTGVVNEVRSGPDGPFVMFQPDERWGFEKWRVGVDLDIFDESVTLPKDLVLAILEKLRLAHIYVLKDSHPEELVPDFKKHKWDGYEVEFAKEITELYLKALDATYEQVMGEPRLGAPQTEGGE
jgi:hypothetical protein